MLNRIRESKGQMAVILSLAIPALVGAVALAKDVLAMLYFNWVQLQKAADAAVLASAKYLTGDPSTDTTQVVAVTGRANSKGQMMVIMTLAMVTLVGAIALGTDVAVAYYNWVQLQKAADSAVLAGANYLTGDSSTNATQVVRVTDNYANANGIQPAEIVSTTVASDYKSVSIQLSRTVPYFFARVLGLTTGGVAARATAGINATGKPIGMTPLGLPCTQADAQVADCNGNYKTYAEGGPLYQFNLPQPNGSIGPGNWEPLAIGASGGSNYRQLIAGGYQDTASVGDLLGTFTEPGHLVGPTVHGFEDRMSNAGATSYVQTPPANPSASDWQVILVPMVDFSAAQGKSYVAITGFAEMWVTNVTKDGTVFAYFLQPLTNNGWPTTTPCEPGEAFPINSCTPVLLQ
jgi:Flp pilus assembly protein TadG